MNKEESEANKIMMNWLRESYVSEAFNAEIEPYNERLLMKIFQQQSKRRKDLNDMFRLILDNVDGIDFSLENEHGQTLIFLIARCDGLYIICNCKKNESQHYKRYD